jgi:hypothetical protein
MEEFRPHSGRLRVSHGARRPAFGLDADADHAGRHAGAPVCGLHGGLSAGAEGPDPSGGATRTRLPPGAATRHISPLRWAVRHRSTAPPSHRAGGRGSRRVDGGVHDRSRESATVLRSPVDRGATHVLKDCADANLVFVRIFDGKISEPVCAVADGAVKYHACLHQLVV